MSDVSNIEMLDYEFWLMFKSYAEAHCEIAQYRQLRNPPHHSSYDISTGRGGFLLRLTVSMARNYIAAGLYMSDSADINTAIKNKKAYIESQIGDSLHINIGSRDTRIYVVMKIDASDRKNWEICSKWLCEKALRFHRLLPEL